MIVIRSVDVGGAFEVDRTTTTLARWYNLSRHHGVRHASVKHESRCLHAWRWSL